MLNEGDGCKITDGEVSLFASAILEIAFAHWDREEKKESDWRAFEGKIKEERERERERKRDGELKRKGGKD